MTVYDRRRILFDTSYDVPWHRHIVTKTVLNDPKGLEIHIET